MSNKEAPNNKAKAKNKTTKSTEPATNTDNTTNRAVVLLSGGADSSTLLAMQVNTRGRENVEALSIIYGQTHAREISSAKKIAEYYNVPLHILDLSCVFTSCDSSLISGSSQNIPHENYAEQLKETHGAPVSTYVPFRNGLFLSAAASMAQSLGASTLMYAAHADDAAGNAYPDCSSAFVDAMASAIRLGSGGELELVAPFVNVNKASVIARGLELGVPYELTWSCYEGGDEPCGICATCRDRRAAFKANGARDPLS